MELNFILPLFSARFQYYPLLAVSARDLKTALKIDDDFTEWFNKIIDNYSLIQEKEYLFIDFNQNVLSKEHKFYYDIYLSLSAAKLICIINPSELSLALRRQLVHGENYLTRIITNKHYSKNTHHLKPYRVEHVQSKALINKSWNFTIVYLEKYLVSHYGLVDPYFSEIAYSLNEKIISSMLMDIDKYKKIKPKIIRNWVPKNGDRLLIEVLQQQEFIAK